MRGKPLSTPAPGRQARRIPRSVGPRLLPLVVNVEDVTSVNSGVATLPRARHLGPGDRCRRCARPSERGTLLTVDAESPAWLTIPELVERLGVSPGKIHRLIEERHLLAVRRDGVLAVPAAFLLDDEPLRELRGTFVLLADSGFSDEEAMRWILELDDALGAAPIDALRAGRKAEVRRVAQALAF